MAPTAIQRGQHIFATVKKDSQVRSARRMATHAALNLARMEAIAIPKVRCSFVIAKKDTPGTHVRKKL